MAVVPRSYNVANIFQGPVDVYINITPPASSLTPSADTNSLTLDANGQPTSSTGSHLGSVDGPTTVQITEKCNEIMDDQHESPIDVAMDSVEAELDFIIKETNLSRIQQLLTNNQVGGYTSLANSQALYIGGQFDSSMNMAPLLLVSPNRSVIGKFIYVLAYKTYLKSAIPIALSRKKETTYKLKFGCIMDLTRVQGDELMQIVRTK